MNPILTVSAAIAKGEFDDDDAETVKGLDRIGGGRLHALKSIPSYPTHNFPPANMPPPPGFAQNRYYTITEGVGFY